MILCRSEKTDTEGLRNGPRKFPGGPAINSPPSNTEGAGVIPGQGAEILPAQGRTGKPGVLQCLGSATDNRKAQLGTGSAGSGPGGLAIGPMSLTILLAASKTVRL